MLKLQIEIAALRERESEEIKDALLAAVRRVMPDAHIETTIQIGGGLSQGIGVRLLYGRGEISEPVCVQITDALRKSMGALLGASCYTGRIQMCEVQSDVTFVGP